MDGWHSGDYVYFISFCGIKSGCYNYAEEHLQSSLIKLDVQFKQNRRNKK